MHAIQFSIEIDLGRLSELAPSHWLEVIKRRRRLVVQFHRRCLCLLLLDFLSGLGAPTIISIESTSSKHYLLTGTALPNKFPGEKGEDGLPGSPSVMRSWDRRDLQDYKRPLADPAHLSGSNTNLGRFREGPLGHALSRRIRSLAKSPCTRSASSC